MSRRKTVEQARQEVLDRVIGHIRGDKVIFQNMSSLSLETRAAWNEFCEQLDDYRTRALRQACSRMRKKAIEAFRSRGYERARYDGQEFRQMMVAFIAEVERECYEKGQSDYHKRRVVPDSDAWAKGFAAGQRKCPFYEQLEEYKEQFGMGVRSHSSCDRCHLGGDAGTCKGDHQKCPLLTETRGQRDLQQEVRQWRGRARDYWEEQKRCQEKLEQELRNQEQLREVLEDCVELVCPHCARGSIPYKKGDSWIHGEYGPGSEVKWRVTCYAVRIRQHLEEIDDR